MMKNTALLAKACLTVAGVMLVFETILGCIYIVGIGFGSIGAISMDLALTMAFPVYLLAIYSLQGAMVSLWLFFIFQWIVTCLEATPPTIVNPLGWPHGILLFASAILVTLAQRVVSTWTATKKSVKLCDVFSAERSS